MENLEHRKYSGRTERDPWVTDKQGALRCQRPGCAPPWSACADPGLERVVIDRNHEVGPINHVNPLYVKQLEQIHRIDESLKRFSSTRFCSMCMMREMPGRRGPAARKG
jgi:hypothetical protein